MRQVILRCDLETRRGSQRRKTLDAKWHKPSKKYKLVPSRRRKGAYCKTRQPVRQGSSNRQSMRVAHACGLGERSLPLAHRYFAARAPTSYSSATAFRIWQKQNPLAQALSYHVETSTVACPFA
jgi:hypothetical protein